MFVVVAIYAFISMYIMRLVVLPYIAHSVDTWGNLGGDPQYYHALALDLAGRLREFGVSAWELRPEGQGPAGVMGLVYFFTANQFFVVLLNSVLHATSSCFLILLVKEWFSLRVSIFSSLPFVVSPYQIHWFSQINKESYVVCGFFLLLYGVLRLVKYCLNSSGEINSRFVCRFFFCAVVGAFLISLSRPFVVSILQIALGVLFLCVCVFLFVKHRSFWLLVFISVALVSCLGFFTRGAASDRTISEFASMAASKSPPSFDQLVEYPVVNECLVETLGGWRESEFVPHVLDVKLKALLSQRCLYFMQLYDENSMTRASVFDYDIRPLSFVDVVGYFPKAFNLALFFPYPSMWFQGGGRSVFYLMASLEMISFCIFLPFLIFMMVFDRRAHLLWLPVLLSASLIAVYGLGVPYAGALYRYRYPFWMALLSLGMAAFIRGVFFVGKNKINSGRG